MGLPPRSPRWSRGRHAGVNWAGPAVGYWLLALGSWFGHVDVDVDVDVDTAGGWGLEACGPGPDPASDVVVVVDVLALALGLPYCEYTWKPKAP